MKTFLSTLQKQNNHFSILQQSKNIHLVEQEELLILFTGKNISTLDELQIAYQTEGINFHISSLLQHILTGSFLFAR